MDRAEKAAALFADGCNCSQAVFAAFADEFGLDEDLAKRLACGLGGGVGRMREVCGAVSGMLMVTGFKCGYTDPQAIDEKAKLYALVQKLAGEFKEKNGSIICRELLGLSEKSSAPTPEARTPEYYKKRPCKLLVGDACEILESRLN